MILTTARLDLRELTDEDLPALRRILHDPLAMVAYEGAFDDDESLAWLRRMQRRYRVRARTLASRLRGRSGSSVPRLGVRDPAHR